MEKSKKEIDVVQKGEKEILNKFFIDNLRNGNLRISVRGVVVQEESRLVLHSRWWLGVSSSVRTRGGGPPGCFRSIKVHCLVFSLSV
jgi:hypothetical protein